MEIEIVTTMAAEVAAAATAAAQSAAAAGAAAAAAGNAAAASNAAAAAKAAAAGQAVATGSVSNFVNVSAKIRTSAEEASKAVDKAADAQVSRFEKLKKGVEGLHEALKKVGEGLTGIVPGLKGLEDFTSFSGLSSLAQRFGQFSADLEASSRKLGVSTPALAAWHIAADGAGVSAKDFDTGMAKSQDAIRGASKGEAPKTAAAMRRLGVRIARNRDGSVNYGTTQERLMGALHGISNVVDQRDMAGKVGMTEWLPMIQQGTWNEDKAKASRRGLVPTEDEIAKGKAFKDDIDDLSQSVEGLGQRVGFALIPVLDPVVKKMGEWLNAHRAEIVDQITAAVQQFVKWVSKIDWDKVAQGAGQLFDALGGIRTAAITVGAISFAGPLLSAGHLIYTLTRLATDVVPKAAEAFGVFSKLPMFAGRLAPMLGVAGTVGVAGVAAAGGLALAKAVGLPDVDAKLGIDDVRRGRWWAASAHLPAGSFISAIHAHLSGKSNEEIASKLESAQGTAAAGTGDAGSQNPSSGAAGGTPASRSAVSAAASDVAVRVTFDNLPNGARVDARADTGVRLTTKVNRSMMNMGALV